MCFDANKRPYLLQGYRVDFNVTYHNQAACIEYSMSLANGATGNASQSCFMRVVNYSKYL
jgi:hypothetical protein